MEEDNSNKPHRVIYYHGPLPRTRVFGNFSAAEEFSKTVNGTIQLASESPNLPSRKCFLEKPKRDRCKCGSTKFTADKVCNRCSGVGLLNHTGKTGKEAVTQSFKKYKM